MNLLVPSRIYLFFPLFPACYIIALYAELERMYRSSRAACFVRAEPEFHIACDGRLYSCYYRSKQDIRNEKQIIFLKVLPVYKRI